MSHDEIMQKIEEILEQVRPNIEMDGGDVQFVRLEDGAVYIRVLGSCNGDNVKADLEEALKNELSEIREVIITEDNDDVQ